MADEQRNMDVVRQGFDAFNTRDVDRLVELSDPDSEWHPFRAQLEGNPYRGHDGIRQFVRDMDDDWQTFEIDVVDLQARGDLVAAVGHLSAVGRSSGVQVDSVAGFVFELDDGMIRRLRSHSDPEAALVELRDPDADG